MRSRPCRFAASAFLLVWLTNVSGYAADPAVQSQAPSLGHIDLQAQIKATAAKVIPGVVNIS